MGTEYTVWHAEDFASIVFTFLPVFYLVRILFFIILILITYSDCCHDHENFHRDQIVTLETASFSSGTKKNGRK